MKKLLESIPLNTKGFVLSYTLYLLAFLLSFASLITIECNSKIELEKQLIEIEEQKYIELIYYSYFYYDHSIASNEIYLDQYVILSESKKEGDNVVMIVEVQKNENNYQIKYTYDSSLDRISKIEYSS